MEKRTVNNADAVEKHWKKTADACKEWPQTDLGHCKLKVTPYMFCYNLPNPKFKSVGLYDLRFPRYFHIFISLIVTMLNFNLFKTFSKFLISKCHEVTSVRWGEVTTPNFTFGNQIDLRQWLFLVNASYVVTLEAQRYLKYVAGILAQIGKFL